MVEIVECVGIFYVDRGFYTCKDKKKYILKDLIFFVFN